MAAIPSNLSLPKTEDPTTKILSELQNATMKQQSNFFRSRPANAYCATVAALSAATGAYTMYALPYNLFVKILGGLVVTTGMSTVSGLALIFMSAARVIRSEEGLTRNAICENENFVQFAKDQNMYTPDSIVKAHKLYKETIAQGAPAA